MLVGTIEGQGSLEALSAHAVQVCCIPQHKWQELGSSDARKAYLQAFLQPSGAVSAEEEDALAGGRRSMSDPQREGAPCASLRGACMHMPMQAHSPVFSGSTTAHPVESNTCMVPGALPAQHHCMWALQAQGQRHPRKRSRSPARPAETSRALRRLASAASLQTRCKCAACPSFARPCQVQLQRRVRHSADPNQTCCNRAGSSLLMKPLCLEHR